MCNNSKLNVVVLGTSCFDGMASSMRVRNLLEPLINENLINVSNLIYEKDANGLTLSKGTIKKIKYRVIEFKLMNIFSLFNFILSGIKFIKVNKSKNQKNILYNYEYPDIKNILFLLYAKLIGYKIIIDIVEDNRYYKTFDSNLNRFKVFSSIFFLKMSPLIAHAVVSISYHLYNLMLQVCKEKIPVYLVPITVNLSHFKQEPYHLPKNFKIFYGGSFGKKDGVENLIKAFEKISMKFDNVELILTGRASYADSESLDHFIEHSVSKNKIHFKGFLETDEYYKVLNQCDIFCINRVNSKFSNAGFPFKLGEYLAAGKAIVVTDVGDIPKYLTTYKNALIVNPGDLDELVSSFLYILENPECIFTLGQQARKVAESYFDAQLLSRQLLEIFKKI